MPAAGCRNRPRPWCCGPNKMGFQSHHCWAHNKTSPCISALCILFAGVNPLSECATVKLNAWFYLPLHLKDRTEWRNWKIPWSHRNRAAFRACPRGICSLERSWKRSKPLGWGLPALCRSVLKAIGTPGESNIQFVSPRITQDIFTPTIYCRN